MESIIEESWKVVLKDELHKSYMKELMAFLEKEYKSNAIFPPSHLIFEAFNKTPFDKVKVVILGQDPYPQVNSYTGEPVATGLSFSTRRGDTIPKSLQNIYKLLSNTIPGYVMPSHGDLTSWAQQGVLLLNATLTVEANKAGSHQKRGWEIFTDAAIKAVSDFKSGVVFILWGRFAQEKERLIDTSKHYIIKSAHPSPFSAHSGFFGSRPFSKTNEFLKKQNLQPIDWQI